MRGIRPGLGMAMTALALGACGTASATVSDPTTLGHRPSTAAAAPRGGAGQVPQEVSPRDSRGPVFPLTLRRTGGIADYADTVVLEATGRVRVETRQVHGRVCTLAKGQREQLFSLLSTLRGDGAGDAPSQTVVSGEPTEFDVIRISLTDARNQLFDLSDPSLGSVSGMVGGLVSDVALTSPSTVSCTTPQA